MPIRLSLRHRLLTPIEKGGRSIAGGTGVTYPPNWTLGATGAGVFYSASAFEEAAANGELQIDELREEGSPIDLGFKGADFLGLESELAASFAPIALEDRMSRRVKIGGQR